jgi:hypothetical protein
MGLVRSESLTKRHFHFLVIRNAALADQNEFLRLCCLCLQECHCRLVVQGSSTSSRLRLKCDGTRAETRFRLSAKRTSPFKSAGVSVQSTTGSRGVRISGNNAGYTMFAGSVKGTGYPIHSPVSPSLPVRCVTVCHHISTGLYLAVTCSNAVQIACSLKTGPIGSTQKSVTGCVTSQKSEDLRLGLLLV